jgi:antitoxin CptB
MTHGHPRSISRIQPERLPMTPRDARIKKLKFRAWHRGFREADFIMGTFADQHADSLDDQGLDDFEALLEAPDQDVYGWLLERTPTPPEFRTPVFDLIKSFRYFARTLWAQDLAAKNPAA